MAFNLFDFSSALNPLGNVSTPPQASPTIGGATGGGMMPPTTTAKPLPQTPIVRKPIQVTSAPSFMEKAVNTVVPKANADIFSWTSYEETGDIFSGTSYSKEQPTQETPKVEPTKIEEKLGQNIWTDIVWGGSNAIYSGIGNVLDFAWSILNPVFNKIDELTGNEKLPERDTSKILWEWSDKQQWKSYNPESKSAFTGKIIWEIALLWATSTAALEKKISELWIKYTPAIASQIITKASEKFPKLLKYTNYFAKGIIPSAQYQIMKEGNLNPKDIAINSAIVPWVVAAKDVGVSGLWLLSALPKSISGVGNEMYNIIKNNPEINKALETGTLSLETLKGKIKQLSTIKKYSTKEVKNVEKKANDIIDAVKVGIKNKANEIKDETASKLQVAMDKLVWTKTILGDSYKEIENSPIPVDKNKIKQ